MANSYCAAVRTMDSESVHKKYHDNEYGFPIDDDNLLFERLILEINQAGLSWSTILNKKENFEKAFHEFNISTVALYKEKDVNRLLNDAGIIRNRLKIAAAIENAKRIRTLQKRYRSFKQWLDHHHPQTKENWVKIFKETFLFTGVEIINEFLMSTGYLPGAHDKNCPVYKIILKQSPPWSLSVSKPAGQV
ncbi:MAG: DNA-3-methyladenine glycosylase I [Chitinophagales bacterium]|nr:DNA-3-methyladenine glycosylase I [Chitinophagales bacterium]